MNKIAVLCAWIYEKVMHPNTLAFPRTILQKLVLLHVILNSYMYFCNTDMQYIICSWISSIEKSKDALDQLTKYLEPSPDVKGKLLAHTCTTRLPVLTKSCAWVGLSSTSCYVTARSISACGQFQTSVWKRRQWWDFGNITIILHHPSLGFSPG